MGSTIKLKQEHLEVIITCIQDVVDWKAETLSVKAFDIFYNQYLPLLLDQIVNNEFKLNHNRKNTMVWIIDQIRHSKKLADGVDPKNAVPLSDTRTGREAISICEKAAKGQLYYNGYYTQNNFQELFR